MTSPEQSSGEALIDAINEVDINILPSHRRLVIAGLSGGNFSYQRLAESMYISRPTVKNHVAAMHHRLGTRSLAQTLHVVFSAVESHNLMATGYVNAGICSLSPLPLVREPWLHFTPSELGAVGTVARLGSVELGAEPAGKSPFTLKHHLANTFGKLKPLQVRPAIADAFVALRGLDFLPQASDPSIDAKIAEMSHRALGIEPPTTEA